MVTFCVRGLRFLRANLLGTCLELKALIIDPYYRMWKVALL